ncbi:MAG: methionyl aminopeptidase [Parachlamydiales bacterium]
MGRNDPCWCGSGQKFKKCHYPQLPAELHHEKLAEQYRKQFGILLKTPEQIAGIRKACRLTAEILGKVCKRAKAGVTTRELADYALELHQEAGAIAAPLGYGEPPFPAPICTSLNEVICHGIPDDQPLVEGDILNIDVSAILDGYYGDTSRMVVIGKTSEERKAVVETAHECLERAIAILKPGVLLSAIGDAITDYAEGRGCSVVHQFVGHGVGLDFHEPPQIPHCRNTVHIPLAPGMTFTIEPMINAGKAEAQIDPLNHWVARTVDGRPSAQWEHTLLITDEGCEVLTR